MRPIIVFFTDEFTSYSHVYTDRSFKPLASLGLDRFYLVLDTTGIRIYNRSICTQYIH